MKAFYFTNLAASDLQELFGLSLFGLINKSQGSDQRMIGSVIEPGSFNDRKIGKLLPCFTQWTTINWFTLSQVSKQMDRVCSAILNSTFQKLQTQMLHRFHGIKSKMPRRESARRNHPLACESDIVETLHMRLTLLQMSFGKHIERKHICFFAGEVLTFIFH